MNMKCVNIFNESCPKPVEYDPESSPKDQFFWRKKFGAVTVANKSVQVHVQRLADLAVLSVF
jgi:hypothetical protein